MLRLPIFGTSAPTSISELVAELSKPGARLVAGGTDLLPNLKHGLESPRTLVSTDQIEFLRNIHWQEESAELRIGASVTLSQIAADEKIASRFPSFSKAAGLVASPLIRNMATIGGNINLDTRCRYVNQTEFWRSTIGGCLKAKGDVCHVVPKGRSCVAAMSSDCVPALISLGARLVQVGPEGERCIALKDYYNNEGTKHTERKAGEFTVEIVLPLPSKPTFANYSKWSVRKSIDYPLLSIAMNFEMFGDSASSEILAATICLGVLGAKPKLLKCDSLIGRVLSAPETAALVGELCFKQGKTLENVPYEAGYRRKMLRVFGRRAVLELC